MDKEILEDEYGEYTVPTYEELFDEAEETMHIVKGDVIDFLKEIILEDNDLEIYDTFEFSKDFLDLCAGKSSYIDNEVENIIDEMIINDEEHIREFLTEKYKFEDEKTLNKIIDKELEKNK